ncbi:hypothetical protein EUTSA_v10001844mg [Eutrema salsugineum]|uniref:F-box associated beta-propeller type 1 domain-containing protein n=1 Tax=Eutrema salsugineum TaxID=72664 RepID=V4L943_EUTSA|nr:hypothetical protein EUTSA_v10001844mg [Eutrema salsugineum]
MSQHEEQFSGTSPRYNPPTLVLHSKIEYGTRNTFTPSISFASRSYFCKTSFLCTISDHLVTRTSPCSFPDTRISCSLRRDSCGGSAETQSLEPFVASVLWGLSTAFSSVLSTIASFLHRHRDLHRCLSFLRVLYNAPNVDNYKTRFHGVSLKCNTYWLAYNYTDYSLFLLNFDFTREKFKRLDIPRYRGCWKLSVVREEELSVLSKQKYSLEVEIWVTKKIDTEAEFSWSKSFVVDLHCAGGRVYVFTSLSIDEEKKVVLCSTFRNGEYHTETIVLQDKFCLFIFNYVPSLVPIQ